MHNKIKLKRVELNKTCLNGLMKNKKGFIRIIEAILAILVIMGAALILISNNVQTLDISKEVHEKQRYILDVVANNETMRQEILDGGLTFVNEFVSKNIPPSWKFSLCVTDIDTICNNSPPSIDSDIYVSEAIISATTTTYTNSKKLRFFIWR